MKLLICGDFHLTPYTPKNRLDDFKRTSIVKLTFILETARKNKVDFIVQPGDFTDTPFTPWSYFVMVANLINDYRKPILTVYGQHDLRYRNKGNTCLDGLRSACPFITILDKDAPHLIAEDVIFVGASYGEEIPFAPKGAFSVLITHRMIIASELEKAWATQREYEIANSFMNNHKYDLIVSGDNHQYFESLSHTVKGRKFYLINCGALLRSKIIEENHKPMCIVYDVEKRSSIKIAIPIESPSKIFNLEMMEEMKERSDNLGSFILGLSEHKEMGLSFESNLNQYCEINKIDKKVKYILNKWKERVSGDDSDS